MTDDVHFRETHHIQRSTWLSLAVIFTMSGLPLVFLSVWGREFDLAVFAVGIGAIVVPSAVFRRQRWEVEVRDDGVHYRVLPFWPFWRHVVDVDDVETARVDTLSPASLSLGTLFGLGSGDLRVYCAHDDAKPRGVRIGRSGSTDAFFGSDSPAKFADAVNTLANV